MIVPNNKSYGKHVRKKLLPEYYEAVKRRVKTFELRRDEDDIQPGDVLELYEWDGERYTGHKLTREVTYVLRNCPQYGLADGYCIIGIMPIGWDTPYTVLACGSAPEYQAIVAAAAAALTPRVLALDEIMGHDGALFVEDRIRMAVYPVLYIAEHRPDARMATWWGIESYEQDGYGDWWRCWTRRPTPEDMALTPWTVATDEGGAV